MKYNLFERTIQKIDKILCKVETFVSVGCITLCGAILLFSIINRLWIKLPLRWTEEASRMLLILTVFSAQPIVTRESAHLKLAFLSEMLTGTKAAKILDFISDASVFAIFAVVFYLFSTYTISLTHYNQLSPAMGYPMWVLYAILSLMLLDTLFRALLVIWDKYFSKKNLFTHGDDDFSVN